MARRVKVLPGQLALFAAEDRMSEEHENLGALNPDQRDASRTATKRRPKVTPKKTPEERYEEQKRALQRLTLRVLDRGEVDGLGSHEVADLKAALLALGWLPRDVQG